jgi:hypothetical protein
MPTIDVTILDEVIPATRKRAIAASVAGALAALGGGDAQGLAWRIVAAPAPVAVAQAQPAARPAALDYATWHAHLAGTRRAGPGGGNGPTP